MVLALAETARLSGLVPTALDPARAVAAPTRYP